MVANSPPEPTADQYAALVQRLDAMQRQIDESGRSSKFPFVVSHGGVQDFSIIPSTSGDGTADIAMGNGAGGRLIQVLTDTNYGTKIFIIRDQQGAPMMSTDALAGYGLGTPSYPFVYQGFPWNTTLGGCTSQGTAGEIGRGASWVYNPATVLNIAVRATSTTAETLKLFVQWKDVQGNLNNTADQTIAVNAGGSTFDLSNLFAKNWQADDMNGLCFCFIKAYVTSANPGNVGVQCSFGEGYGVSQGFYNQFSSGWAV